MSGFGGGTDVQQTRVITVVIITVLPLSAIFGHTAQCKTAPKGRIWMKLLSRFLASGDGDQTQQA